TMEVSIVSHRPCSAPAMICGPILSKTSHDTFLLSTCTFMRGRSALLTSVTAMPVSLANGSANALRMAASYAPPQQVTVMDFVWAVTIAGKPIMPVPAITPAAFSNERREGLCVVSPVLTERLSLLFMVNLLGRYSVLGSIERR